jgi:hypothetical protein
VEPACLTRRRGARPNGPARLVSLACVPDLDDDLGHLVRRLRGFSARTWAAGGRESAVRRLAAELVALGELGHSLPELPRHALADAVAVLAHEAIENGRRDEVAAAVRRTLEETR